MFLLESTFSGDSVKRVFSCFGNKNYMRGMCTPIHSFDKNLDFQNLIFHFKSVKMYYNWLGGFDDMKIGFKCWQMHFEIKKRAYSFSVNLYFVNSELCFHERESNMEKSCEFSAYTTCV